MFVEEYARQFNTICRGMGIEAPSEGVKIQRFKTGLHPNMKLKVASQTDGTRWTEYSKIVSFASAV
jgi:hypothetical protein